jgi:hypothetical protein
MATERIYALFQDVADAERAIGALADHGISRDAIGVVARRPAEQAEAGRVRSEFTRLSDQTGLGQGEPETTYEARPGALPPASIQSTVTPTSSVDTVDNVSAVGKSGITTTTPQDAGAGAAVGTGIGLVAGLLLAAAAIAVPGAGLVLAGGAFATALAGAAGTTVAGAIAGGVTGYLRDMGMPEHAAQNIADRLHEGDYLLTVDADTSQYDDLKMLLNKYNAVGIDSGTTTIGSPVPPAAVSGQPVAPVRMEDGTYDLSESQIVDPVTTEPTLVGTAPRQPANPALAQETEPVILTSTVPSEEITSR